MNDRARGISSSKTPQQQYDDAKASLASRITPVNEAAAKALAYDAKPGTITNITPEVAFVVTSRYSGANRDLSLAKVFDYAQAMTRGDWRLTHQGLAFDAQGQLIDGQHRCAAVILSQVPIQVLVTNKMDPNIIDVIDQSARRKAHEGLTIAGISDAPDKERITRGTMEYRAKLNGRAVERPTVVQIHNYVLTNDKLLSEAIRMAVASTKGVADPSMSQTFAAGTAHLMQMGGWQSEHIQEFLIKVQAGVDQQTDGVIVPCARIMTSVTRAEKRSDRLSRDHVFATLLKAARHWVQHESVARFKPVTKAPLTDYHAVDTEN